MYRLKKGVESFTVVDGPFEGRTFEKGRAYADIPPQEKGKFEEVKETSPASTAEKPAKADKQRVAAIKPAENAEVTK